MFDSGRDVRRIHQPFMLGDGVSNRGRLADSYSPDKTSYRAESFGDGGGNYTRAQRIIACVVTGRGGVYGRRLFQVKCVGCNGRGCNCMGLRIGGGWTAGRSRENFLRRARLENVA